MTIFRRSLLVSMVLALTVSMGALAQEDASEAVISPAEIATALQCDIGDPDLPELQPEKLNLDEGTCGICFCGTCCQCPRRSSTGSCCADGGCTGGGDPVCLAVSQCTCISNEPEV